MTTQQPARLLRAAIDSSGLSARRFAVRVLLRDERTVRRWLAGDSPVPRAVADWLRAGARPSPCRPFLVNSPRSAADEAAPEAVALLSEILDAWDAGMKPDGDPLVRVLDVRQADIRRIVRG
jgi:hypothetical protein